MTGESSDEWAELRAELLEDELRKPKSDEKAPLTREREVGVVLGAGARARAIGELTDRCPGLTCCEAGATAGGCEGIFWNTDGPTGGPVRALDFFSGPAGPAGPALLSAGICSAAGRSTFPCVLLTFSGVPSGPLSDWPSGLLSLAVGSLMAMTLFLTFVMLLNSFAMDSGTDGGRLSAS